jgi:hypothetical protein
MITPLNRILLATDGSEDAETSGAGDGGGHRGERREAEDGVLDSEFLAQLRLHGRRMPQRVGRRKRFSDAVSDSFRRGLNRHTASQG